MKCLLSTNAKDEHNIFEWIEYHLLLGFDYILVWDDLSQIPIEYVDTRVRIIRHHAKKIDYMTDSVAFAKRNGYDWILHLDVDEYLYLGVNRHLKEFMRTYLHHNIMVVYFPWTIFGSNYLNVLSPRGSCLEPFTRCNTRTHNYIKTFARVQTITDVKNAHEFKYSQPQTTENTVYAPDKTVHQFSAVQARHVQPITLNRCFIAHFRFQSWDLFRERKGRARDDTLKPYKFQFALGDEPSRTFHANSNQMMFPYVWQNYVQWKKKMTK